MADEIVTKAKLTTSLGTFEFEGAKDFVAEQVAKITDKFQEIPPQPVQPEATQGTKQNQIESAESVQSTKSKKLIVEQPKLLGDLITDSAKIKELKEFVSAKKPASHLERFLVLTYWMKTNLSMKELSIDEMWTAYKMLTEKPPRVLIQVFRDAKSKKGWFTTGSGAGRYQLTSIGETYVEHDLPKSNSKN